MVSTDKETEDTLAAAFMRLKDREDAGEIVEGAIDRIEDDGTPLTYAQQLAADMQNEPPTKREAERANLIAQAGKPSINIWTIDRMRKLDPIPVTMEVDGEAFTFDFKPLLGDAYCQERFARVDPYLETRTNGALRSVQEGYAEIVALCVCRWDLRETVQDEDGNDIMDEVKQGAQTITQVRTVPLAITLANVKRLGPDIINDLVSNMTDVYQGKTKEQASSSASEQGKAQPR